MYLGRIVEIGPAEAIYADPKHPYTQALLRAIPEPDPLRTIPRDLPRGEVPDASQPPLGCSFHPRCPKAFKVCGWETRDLRDLLETRWARMDHGEFEAERTAFGDLAVLDRSATRIRLPAAGADALRILETMHAEDPGEPFWTGVRTMREIGGALEVEWHDPIEPRLHAVGEVSVECHLFDGAMNDESPGSPGPQ